MSQKLQIIMMHRAWRLALSSWLGFLGCGAFGAEARSTMELDPAFEPAPVVHTIPDGLIPLWLDALQRDDIEAEVACEVARGLVSVNQLGISLPTNAVEALAQQLQKQKPSDAASLVIARALVDLDAKQYASLLISQLPGGGRDMAEIVEPALARWRERALRDQWLARLKAPNAPMRSVQLAVEALGEIEDQAAQPLLEGIAADPHRHPALRIAAAKALSRVAKNGAAPFAKRLLASEVASNRLTRLVAALTLSRQRGGEALDLLVQLSADNEPAVAAIAVEAVLQADAARLLTEKSKLLTSDDPKLRLLGIRALQQDGDKNIVGPLAGMLGDVHSGVCGAAVDALINLAADAAWRDQVGKRLSELLDAKSSRSTTAALRVLGAIDFEPAAPVILKLLDAEDPDVAVDAASALERLAVASTAEPILRHVVRGNERTVEIVARLAPLYTQPAKAAVDLPNLEPTYNRLEHLILALGQLRYRPADDILQRFVPKPEWAEPGGPPPLEAYKQPRPRAAAIWALGKIHERAGEEAPAKLVAMISERLNDVTPIPREEPIVRRMAAISLARMGQQKLLPTLRAFADVPNPDNEIGRACQWGVERLTGQSPAAPRTRTVRHIDWFLVPLDP